MTNDKCILKKRIPRTYSVHGVLRVWCSVSLITGSKHAPQYYCFQGYISLGVGSFVNCSMNNANM